MTAPEVPAHLAESLREGRFVCPACNVPLTADDFAAIGLRAPDIGESADEYCDEELLDPLELRHLACLSEQYV